MASFTENDLKEKIRTNPCGAYFLYGEETYLVKVYTDRIVNALVDESFTDFNLHVLEGQCDVSEIYDAVMAVPVMSETKCVVVKDFDPEDESNSVLEAFESMLKDNPEDNALVLSFPTTVPKGKFSTSLQNLFSKYGTVVNFSKKTVSDLAKIVEAGAKKRGKTFSAGVSQSFVNCVGTDMNLLLNELDKLCAYADDTITNADVNAVCSRNLDAKAFDMVRELTAGRFSEAFAILSTLFALRESEILILGALISQYSDMYRARAAKNAGEKPAAVAQYYPSYSGKEFKLDKAGRVAEKMSLDQIGRCIDILSDADRAMKSTAVNPKMLLEQTLVKLSRTDISD